MGAEAVKTAQGTIKIAEFQNLSPDLTHFLAAMKEFSPFLTQVVGAQAPTTEYETTPLRFSVPDWPNSSPPRHGRKRNIAAKLRVVPAFFFSGTFYLVYIALVPIFHSWYPRTLADSADHFGGPNRPLYACG